MFNSNSKAYTDKLAKLLLHLVADASMLAIEMGVPFAESVHIQEMLLKGLAVAVNRGGKMAQQYKDDEDEEDDDTDTPIPDNHSQYNHN